VKHLLGDVAAAEVGEAERMVVGQALGNGRWKLSRAGVLPETERYVAPDGRPLLEGAERVELIGRQIRRVLADRRDLAQQTTRKRKVDAHVVAVTLLDAVRSGWEKRRDDLE
jgi:hypothetical protein